MKVILTMEGVDITGSFEDIIVWQKQNKTQNDWGDSNMHSSKGLLYSSQTVLFKYLLIQEEFYTCLKWINLMLIHSLNTY